MLDPCLFVIGMFSFCLTLKMVVWVSLVVQSSPVIRGYHASVFHFRFHFHFLVFTQGGVKHLILPCEVLMATAFIAQAIKVLLYSPVMNTTVTVV